MRLLPVAVMVVSTALNPAFSMGDLDKGMIESLSSADWFVYGAPNGDIRATTGHLHVRAIPGREANGLAGAIWRAPARRPDHGERYVYVWRFREHSILQPGCALISLKPEAETLTPLGPQDYFGLMTLVSPAHRRYGRMVRNGELVGYHDLPVADPIDIRFVLTPTGQRLELKPSAKDQWLRFPAPENPWRNTDHQTLFLHLGCYGGAGGENASNYWVRGVQVTDQDLSHPAPAGGY